MHWLPQSGRQQRALVGLGLDQEQAAAQQQGRERAARVVPATGGRVGAVASRCQDRGVLCCPGQFPR